MSFKCRKLASSERRPTAKRSGRPTSSVRSTPPSSRKRHLRHIHKLTTKSATGPIRLATVCGGLALAWFWTWFPYPLTESAVLRRSTAKCMYLMANYYSILHETFKIRVRGEEEPNNGKDNPSYQLDKARSKIYSKANILLASTREQAGFVRFDIPIGGPFPRQKYTEIINLLQDSLNYMALISIASASFTDAPALHSSSSVGNAAAATVSTTTWLHTLRPLIASATLPAQALTSLLSLLSSALNTPQPLPPYLSVPEPWALTSRLETLDADVLSVRHVAEPGYASLAVVQIAQQCLVEDLRRLLDGVRELVGELDFSWTVISKEAGGEVQRGGEKLE
nr:hypothetical protein CFP56_66508 [Quercus suber]